MTPAARVQAAIDVLDIILAGGPAEKTLTTWARKNRYAGSSDRAAIRDHVFDAMRRRRSLGWLGGGDTGRRLMLGALRAGGVSPDDIFTGEGYAPLPLTVGEGIVGDLAEAPDGVRLDMPDWLLPDLHQSLGAQFEPVCQALQDRAPVFLRSNSSKTTREAVALALLEEKIETRPHSLSPTALEVISNARRVKTSRAFNSGLIEIQDAASQAVVDALPLSNGDRVLDYCAGGGGKALAIAARADVRITAHDTDPGRMRDIPHRAARAGAQIEVVKIIQKDERQAFDLVLCDAPCSGTGAWRRTPDAKWLLTEDRLHRLRSIQAQVLDEAMDLTRPGGCLAYVTCSLLQSENSAQISGFLSRHPTWRLTGEMRLTPMDGGDGFYLGLLNNGP